MGITKHDFLATRFHQKDLSVTFDKCRGHEDYVARKQGYATHLQLELTRMGWSKEEAVLLTSDEPYKAFFNLIQNGISYEKWLDTSYFLFFVAGG